MKYLRGNTKGFTLLEILIVLVILAVLAGLAVPAYISSIEKQRKQEAISTLGAIRSSQLRYFQGRNTFAPSFADLDFDPTIAVAGSNPHYTYTIDAAGAANFSATATRNAVDGPPAAVPAGYTVNIDENGTITSEY